MTLATAARLTLHEVARKLDVNMQTIWRWTTRGVRGRKLPSIIIGGRRYILEDELEEFLQNGREGNHESTTEPHTGSGADRAASELESVGI